MRSSRTNLLSNSKPSEQFSTRLSLMIASRPPPSSMAVWQSRKVLLRTVQPEISSSM